MFSIFFYIFLVLITFAGMLFAFSGKTANSAFSFVVLMSSVFGLFVLVNSELLALLGLITLSILFSLMLIFSNKGYVKGIFEEYKEKHQGGKQFGAIIILELFGGVSASLASSTNWRTLKIDYGINSLGLIFTKYLPLVLLIIFMLSVLLASLKYVLRKDAQAG